MSWLEYVVEENDSPHSQETKKRRGAFVPLSPQGNTIYDLRTSHRPHLPKVLTTSQLHHLGDLAFNTWAFGGHSRTNI
jgi:hypothetical protein